MCLALLLWARLIVVSNMPRTAIADDALVEAQEPPEAVTPSTVEEDEDATENETGSDEMELSHVDN